MLSMRRWALPIAEIMQGFQPLPDGDEVQPHPNNNISLIFNLYACL